MNINLRQQRLHVMFRWRVRSPPAILIFKKVSHTGPWWLFLPEFAFQYCRCYTQPGWATLQTGYTSSIHPKRDCQRRKESGRVF